MYVLKDTYVCMVLETKTNDMCKLEQLRDAMLEQQEYEERELIFMCKATSEFPPDEYYSICKFEGTKKQLDAKVESIKLIDKDFEYIIERTFNNFSEWAKVYRTDEDTAVRRSMSMNKENVRRQADYKYLKSSY